jgi:mRNA deadenylase 3'-5' endonuclease subunit Ccr4
MRINKQSADKYKMTTNKYEFRIITFNLLSSSCATKEYYPYVRSQYLDFEARSTRVKKLIESWTKVNFIILLQEVDELWFKTLDPVFRDKNYQTHSVRYGTMGQLIGFPTKHYDLMFVDQFIPGIYVKEICEKIKETESKESKENKESKETENNKVIMNQMLEGSESQNQMISVGLSAKYYGKKVNKHLIVSTYHMPCKFKDQFLMISHVHALKMRLGEIMSKWKQFDSVVLGGDFNMLETSNEYMYMTDPGAENLIIDLMDVLYCTIGLDLRDTIALNSAHSMCHDKEPEYTNCSVKKNKSFVGTLDYVFISDNIGVRSCTVGLIAPPNLPNLPSEQTETQNDHVYFKKTRLPLYPNAVCPSDHLALSTSLFIDNAKK